jgi:hypothetical protein
VTVGVSDPWTTRCTCDQSHPSRFANVCGLCFALTVTPEQQERLVWAPGRRRFARKRDAQVEAGRVERILTQAREMRLSIERQMAEKVTA